MACHAIPGQTASDTLGAVFARLDAFSGDIVSAERKRQSERAHFPQNLSNVSPTSLYGNNVQT